MLSPKRPPGGVFTTEITPYHEEQFALERSSRAGPSARQCWNRGDLEGGGCVIGGVARKAKGLSCNCPSAKVNDPQVPTGGEPGPYPGKPCPRQEGSATKIAEPSA